MICPLLICADRQKAITGLAEVFQPQIAWCGDYRTAQDQFPLVKWHRIRTGAGKPVTGSWHSLLPGRCRWIGRRAETCVRSETPRAVSSVVRTTGTIRPGRQRPIYLRTGP
jgi:hypothetical protein